MRDMGKVRGSAEQAQPLVVGKDTVYVHDNITQLHIDSDGNPTDNLFEYHEIQYDYTEYFHMMLEKDILQTAQIRALSDRNDFNEDCMAEMASIIYS